MERKNVVLLTVIAVATLLTAMVGSTFAYFTATVNGKGNETKVVDATAATVSATYTEGSNISMTDIAPGQGGSKTITIENTSDVAIDYVIDIQSYTNGFENLEYKLVNNASGNNTNEGNNIVGTKDVFTKMETENLTGTNNTLVSGHLAAGEKHVFDLSIQLKETDAPQPNDTGKTFSGKLFASAKASKVTE